MTEFKGTKGKWYIDGIDVATSEEGVFGNIVCVPPEGFEASMVNWFPNAVLISKAPEMLEILKELSKHHGLFPDDRIKIKQLIKEATSA